MPDLSPAIERELGHVLGFLGGGGIPYDDSEQSAELQWPQSVHIFDQMRRQDAEVGGVLRGLTLPVRRATWAIDQAGARPDVTAEIAEQLGLPVMGQPAIQPVRTRGRFSWAEHLRMALLSLPLGHMVFEQVYRIDPDGRARLRKLAPRMPRTLAKINVAQDGGLTSVEQYGLQGQGPLITIPVDRLVWYSNEQEGGNWQGLSVLRSCYKNWLLKDRFLRVWAMTVERNGMGVPVAEAAPNATPAQVADLNAMAEAFRAGEYSGAALPPGAKLTLQGVNGTLPDIAAAVSYHDSQIAKNVLAQFLELGQSAHGSRALGQSMIDFFGLALDAIAKQVADVFNAHVIEDIVDLNWGENEPAPRLVPPSPSEQQELLPEALGALIERGAITPDDDLEAWLRSRHKLPARNTAEPAHTPQGAGQGAPVAASRPATARAAKRTGKAWATAETRRASLYNRMQARQKAAIAQLAAQLDLPAIIDAAQAAIPVQVMAAAGDPAAQAVESALTAGAAATPAVRQATADALREATAEGATGAKGLLLQARENVVIDFDLVFEEQMAALADADALLTAADPWVAKQLAGLAHDIGAQLAKQLAGGASREQMAASITAALGSPQSAWLFLDNAIATSLSDGAVDLYTSEGVAQIDFMSTGDNRVDEDCADAEAASPWAISDCPKPPLHLNCRCVVAVPAGGG